MSHYYSASNSGAQQRLHLTWWILLTVQSALAISIYLVLGYLFWHQGSIRLQWTRLDLAQWLGLALLVIALECWFLRHNLAKNHRRGEHSLLPSLGLGNGLTLMRGLAYAFMAGFLFSPRPGGWLDWAPALLYAAACLADMLDGYLARLTNHTTLLGEILDIEFDGFGLLMALLLAVQYGQLPAVILLLAVARPLFVLGLRLRQQMNLPEYPMTESTNRRIVAGLLMACSVVVLCPLLEPPVTYALGFLFGFPVLLSFLRDWLVVTGWIDPSGRAYQQARRVAKGIIFLWLPLLLRGAGALLLCMILWQAVIDPLPWRTLFNDPESESTFWLLSLLVLGGVTTVMVLLGSAARLSGASVILLALIDIITRGLSWENGALLAAGSLLILIGSGRYALWTPEEKLFQTRLGSDAR
jgi:CDP-diacylglycerol---glycerol-3-phosphate 3-phosphatidyltransferase